MLSKRRSLLANLSVNEALGFVEFTDEDAPGTPEVDRSPFFTICRIDQETWSEMGQPKEITVTIEPGDLLNGITFEERLS